MPFLNRASTFRVDAVGEPDDPVERTVTHLSLPVLFAPFFPFFLLLSTDS